MSANESSVSRVRIINPRKVQLWHLLAGGVAGGVSRTLTSPLERLKVLRQCSQPDFSKLGLLDSLLAFYRREGFKGFFRGNGSNVLKVIPFTAVEFFVFDQSKQVLSGRTSSKNLDTLICGSVAGASATLLTYPLDLVKTGLSIRTANQQIGIAQALRSICQQHGPFGCYKGVLTSLIGIVPFIGFKMATFDLLKREFESTQKHTFASYLLFGGISGGTAMLATYPIEVVRRNIQLLALDTRPYLNIRDFVKHVYRNEGVLGFYRGLIPSFLKITPAMAIVFALNEQIKNLVGI